MGILDDAIREHLELKRSHGASEEEIRRKEAEAFGPVRSDAVAAAPADEHTQLLAPDEPAALAEPHPSETALGHPAEPAVDQPTEAWTPDFEPLEPAPEDPYEVHPGDSLVPDSAATPRRPSEHREDEQHPALIDHDHIGGEEHPPEPVFRQEAPAAEPAPIDDPPVGDPPVEHPDIDEPPPRQSPEQAHADDEEDVLEETPEFLQDAPEHDRLWFEQKPPRDFDFGE